MKRKECHVFIYFLLVGIFFTFSYGNAQKKAMTPESLYEMIKLSDPQVSPDGKWIAYTQAEPRLDENKYISDIWLMPISGGHAKRLTRSEGSNYSPRWSPTSKELLFVSTRHQTANLFILPIDGGEARQLTHSVTDLYSPKWAGSGGYILCQ